MVDSFDFRARARRFLADLARVEERLADDPGAILAQTAGAWPTRRPLARAAMLPARGLPGRGSTAAMISQPPPWDDLDAAVDALRWRVLSAGRRAVSKMRKAGPDADLDPEESVGLEAVIALAARPALLIQGDRFAPAAPPWEILEGFRASVERVCRSVGRIDVDHPRLDYAGTAFLVADDVIMTNRHVAELFCRHRGDGAWSFTAGTDPCIDYVAEWGTAATAKFTLTEVVAVLPEAEPDLALFRVSRASREAAAPPEPLTLAIDGPELPVGRKVFTVGYPYQREDDPEVVRRLFGDVYGVKRLQPGEILESIEERLMFQHDCSTLGGNSGSCVVDLETGRVLGLHFGGRHLAYNKAVALWTLREHRVLQRAGVHFA